MIFSVSLVLLLGNLQLLTRAVIQVLRVWMPLSGCQCTSERGLSHKCQKWSSDFMVVAMASSTCWGLLLFLGDVCIVNQGLEGLPVVTIKHHFHLLPASLCGVSFFGVEIEELQEVNSLCIEHFPVL